MQEKAIWLLSDERQKALALESIKQTGVEKALRIAERLIDFCRSVFPEQKAELSLEQKGGIVLSANIEGIFGRAEKAALSLLSTKKRNAAYSSILGIFLRISDALDDETIIMDRLARQREDLLEGLSSYKGLPSAQEIKKWPQQRQKKIDCIKNWAESNREFLQENSSKIIVVVRNDFAQIKARLEK